MPTRIFLIRHAETEATLDDRFAGATDVPLSDVGRGHAEQLATRLASFALHAVYASPLQRTMETARLIATSHSLEVISEAALREIDHGHWEGLTRAEVEQKYPDEYKAYEHDPLLFHPAGGESPIALVERAAPALLEIVRRNPDQTVAVISHKATNRLLISYFLGIELRGYRDKLGQRPACLNVLDFTDEKARLSLFNDISHYHIMVPPDIPYVV